MAQRWFVSHPSGGPQHTPTFFRALNLFAKEHSGIELVLPHEKAQQVTLTREDISRADLVLVEVSIASTGSGIELGWANAAGKSVIAFHQGTATISPAVQFVATAIHAYLREEDIIKVLKTLA